MYCFEYLSEFIIFDLWSTEFCVFVNLQLMLVFKTYSSRFIFLEQKVPHNACNVRVRLLWPTNPNMQKGYRTLAYAMQVPQIH